MSPFTKPVNPYLHQSSGHECYNLRKYKKRLGSRYFLHRLSPQRLICKVSDGNASNCHQLSDIMGQAPSLALYKHHSDPAALNAQTLELRNHMFGEPDVVVIVRDVRFPVHRKILKDNSSYFKSMFSAFHESTESEVELKDLIDPVEMGQAIHYMYFKKMFITPNNAQDLLQLAIFLQMQELQKLCTHYMQSRIDKRNCISLYIYTTLLGPYELRCHAENYILTHFEQVVKKSRNDFLSLEVNELIRLISSDKLLVSSEGSVYKAVMQWVNHDVKGRHSHLPNLLKHVQFELMSENEFTQFQKNPKFKKNEALSFVFDEAKKYFDKDIEQKRQYWADQGSKPPRWPKIFIVMRMYWKNLPMEYFDFKTKQWQALAEVKSWRSCSALVSHASVVYLVGGEELDSESPTGSRTVNRVTKFDCEKQKWSSAPSMNLARRWAAAVVMDNAIYVIGGIGGKGGTYERRLDSMECLDLTVPKVKWKTLPPMSTARSSHTVEVLDNKIYVVGGGDGKDWLCTSEVFCPKENKWSLISNLKTKRWKCGLCVLNGFLYAIGGMDSPNAGFWGSPLESVEKYCPITDEWIGVASMNEARFGSAVVSHHGKIYVSGGFGQGKAMLSSTECYDPESNKWTKVGNMKKMSGFVGGVLVDRPVHLDESGTF